MAAKKHSAAEPQPKLDQTGWPQKSARGAKNTPRPGARFLRLLRLFAAGNFLAERDDSAEQQCKWRKENAPDPRVDFCAFCGFLRLKISSRNAATLKKAAQKTRRAACVQPLSRPRPAPAPC